MIDLALRIGRTVLDAIEIIESNPAQAAFVVDEHGTLKGVLTNGDVRRFLLRGGGVSDDVINACNPLFRSVGMASTREELLKLFDLGFGVVPRVDERGRLIDFATPDLLAPLVESRVIARSRAPARISFGGGGTDLTYFFFENGGAVLNAALASYCSSTLNPLPGPEIEIHSEDIGKVERYTSLRELLDADGKGLISSVVAIIRPRFGFQLYVHSDFPVGSGLGGSSAVATSVIAAFNELRIDRWSNYEVAELAFQAERLHFGVAGGWQDHYASTFGGFNLIEFGKGDNLVHPIRLPERLISELEACLMLIDTRIQRNSGEIHGAQRRSSSNENRKDRLSGAKEICSEMHRLLLRGDLIEFAKYLDKGWRLKRLASEGTANGSIDELYDLAMSTGAIGGKLLGAGEGGFFLFFVEPHKRHQVVSSFGERGLAAQSVRFESKGVISWRTRPA